MSTHNPLSSASSNTVSSGTLSNANGTSLPQPDELAVAQFNALTSDDNSDHSDQGESGNPPPHPLVAQTEQLEQLVIDFEAGEIDSRQLEIALLDYYTNLSREGIASGAFSRRGRMYFQRLMDEMPPSVRYYGNIDDVGNNPVTFRFSRLSAADQSVIVRETIDMAAASAPAVFNPTSQQALDLSFDIIVTSDVVSIEALSQQAAHVQALAGGQLDTPEKIATLRIETTRLAQMYQQAGIGSRYWTLNSAGDDMSIRYSSHNPPPASVRYYDVNEWAERGQSVTLTLSRMSAAEQREFATELVASVVTPASRFSLDYADVFVDSTPAASDRMLRLQSNLSNVVPADVSVDLDTMYRVATLTAENSLARNDLAVLEGSSLQAANAALGEQMWGLGRDQLFELHHWIEGDGVAQPRFSDGDNGEPPMPERERLFLNAWQNTSRDTRLEYLGIDRQAWIEAAPHIDLAIQVNKARRDARFGLDDLVKIGIGYIITKISVGTLGPMVSGWLSSTVGLSAGAASVVGTSFATAVGTSLSTYVTTGEWTAAREAFTDFFTGDLKDALIRATLNRFGVNPQLANIAVADNREELIRVLGADLIREFSPDVINAIKEFSPDVVDEYLVGLNEVIQATDDSEVISEYSASFWGLQLASLLGVKDAAGVTLVSELLRTAVSDGSLDIEALRDYVGTAAGEYFEDLPDAVVARLGGKDNTVAVIAGMGTQFLVENDFDLEATEDDMKSFIEDLAKSWAGDTLADLVDWLPGTDSFAADFRGLNAHAQQNGWNSESIDEYLDCSPLIRNIVSSFVPSGVSNGMLARAYQFAQENGFDRDTFNQFVTGELIGVVADAGITQDIVRVMGGDKSVFATMTNVFGERFIANGGDMDATMDDMRKYARAYAAGFVGDFASSVFSNVVGPQAGRAVDGLIDLGIRSDWNHQQIDTYVTDNILEPLGETASTMLLGAFGGKDNFIARLVSEASESYIAGGGDSDAARDSAMNVVMSALDPDRDDNADGAISEGNSDEIIIGVDESGNRIDLSTFRFMDVQVADVDPSLAADGGGQTVTDVTGSIMPMASYTSAMQAVLSAPDLEMGQRMEMLIDTTRFYMSNWAKDNQTALSTSRDDNQLYWMHESNMDPNLNRAFALLGRVGHNLADGVVDVQSFILDQDFRDQAGASLYRLMTDPAATATSIMETAGSLAGLPFTQQLELGVEIGLTALVGSGGLSVGSRAGSVIGDVDASLAGRIDYHALSTSITGRVNVSDDFVYIPRFNASQLHGGFPIVNASGETLFKIKRLSDVRNRDVDVTEYRNPLNNEVVPSGDTRMSIDHIVPVDTIARLPGFETLSRAEMTNLIQDRQGSLDNLMALPHSMNSSKSNLSASDWARQGYGGQALSPDYVDWLALRQDEILDTVRAKISEYNRARQ